MGAAGPEDASFNVTSGTPPKGIQTFLKSPGCTVR